MENCIFCKIIAGKIPSDKVYEDGEMLIFKDIAPIAKCHLVAVPKVHFKLLADMDEQKADTVRDMLVKIPRIASKVGLSNGYRLIINQGEDAGQTVFHLHMHLLGGEELSW